MKEKIVLAPQKGPQEMFLATSADICIYGGAAGGGKTFVGSFFIAEKRNKTAGKINIQNNQNKTGYFDEKFPRHDRRF